MRVQSLIVSVFTVVFASGPAAAQPATASIEQHSRTGLAFGVGLGAGNMSCSSTGAAEVCDGVTEAGGIDGHVGYMINPQLAVDGEIWVMAHTENFVTIAHTVNTLGARYWIVPRLWVRVGVGASVARWRYKGPLGLRLSDSTESVPAVMAAVGYEVAASRRFAVDVQLRAGTGFYEEQQAKARNVAIGVGLNWY